MKDGQSVMHMSTGMLNGFFQANQFHQQYIKTFARSKAVFSAFIVPLNSPLKPILQLAINRVREAGTMNYLKQLWEGTFGVILRYQNLFFFYTFIVIPS